ncbi:hypothetical protein DID80_07850 [Candidatus Marinamargulisbacteria bacterium SCGC AAA071-K20]|nr:hypothetical protein DID80_07850 [Candidatus Marinamargulisbacteria bacterium SCGC AAA071-K20]
MPYFSPLLNKIIAASSEIIKRTPGVIHSFFNFLLKPFIDLLGSSQIPVEGLTVKTNLILVRIMDDLDTTERSSHKLFHNLW